jgi:hypothetical protein
MGTADEFVGPVRGGRRADPVQLDGGRRGHVALRQPRRASGEQNFTV